MDYLSEGGQQIHVKGKILLNGAPFVRANDSDMLPAKSDNLNNSPVGGLHAAPQTFLQQLIVIMAYIMYTCCSILISFILLRS